MRNPNFLRNRFVRATALASSAFFLAAPNHVNIDPSLLAAEPYNPELWNGEISNEVLRDITRDYAQDITIILQQPIDTQNQFVRNDYHDANTPFILAETFENLLKEYKEQHNATELQFIQSLSQQYQIPYYRMALLYNRLKSLHSALEFQDDANCYAYSVNDHQNIFYGVTTGTRGWDAAQNNNSLTFQYKNADQYPQFIRATISGAIYDGLIFTGVQQQSRAGYYRVALLTGIATPPQRKENDFHWARQNRDGTWSHKMANLNVTNIDFTGNIITDPTRANFGNYKFVGYFLAPRGGINVGPYYDTRPPASTPTQQSIPVAPYERLAKPQDAIVVTASRAP